MIIEWNHRVTGEPRAVGGIDPGNVFACQGPGPDGVEALRLYHRLKSDAMVDHVHVTDLLSGTPSTVPRSTMVHLVEGMFVAKVAP